MIRELGYMGSVGAALALCVLFAGQLPTAAVARADTITACVQKKQGTTRIVEDASDCRKSETSISWSADQVTLSPIGGGAQGDLPPGIFFPEVAVDGIPGTFSTVAISRIGVDVDVARHRVVIEGESVERPVPGRVRFPPVTFQGLSNTSDGAIAALHEWVVGSPDFVPRDITVALWGRGGETALLKLEGCVVSSGAPGVGGTETGFSAARYDALTVQPQAVLLEEYTPATISDTQTASLVRITSLGSVGTHTYAEGVARGGIEREIIFSRHVTENGQEVTIPNPGGQMSAPLSLIGAMDPLFFEVVMQALLHGNQSLGHFDRLEVQSSVRTLQYDRAWPSSITYFDPAKPYGLGFLTDVEIVSESFEIIPE
jgi:hypothetical protein